MEKKGKRARVPNYSDKDVTRLLDLVEETLPIGSNDRTVVAQGYAMYVARTGRPPRELESLRMKFDKLANTKKPTGDPSCPPLVRLVKRMSREILG